MPPNKFISCDWGTSRLRLRLVEGAELSVTASFENAEGIAATYERWAEHQAQGGGARETFYRAVLRPGLAELEKTCGAPLAGLPLVISGMVSSSIGMINLPYKPMPFAIDGSDLETRLFGASSDFRHDILMISGVCDTSDLMRGEEVQLVGALRDEKPVAGRRLLIFPGTHSKHVVVEGTRAVAVRTYMTGEIFELAAQRSVLVASVDPQGSLESPALRQAFEQGVRVGMEQNMLNALFSVRVRSVLRHTGKAENFHYLSGVVHGCELRDLAGWTSAPLWIVASPDAADRYRCAIAAAGIRASIVEVDVDRSLITGQARVASRIGIFRGAITPTVSHV